MQTLDWLCTEDGAGGSTLLANSLYSDIWFSRASNLLCLDWVKG